MFKYIGSYEIFILSSAQVDLVFSHPVISLNGPASTPGYPPVPLKF